MSGPASLNEFQQNLASRMRDAVAAPVAGTVLGLRSGNRNWLMRLEDAGEILAVPDIVTVPLTQAWYLGLANVRGNLVSVIDFALWAEGRSTPRSAECRVLLLGDRFRCRAALLVQRLLGIKDPHQMLVQQQAVVDARTAAAAWVGATYQDGGGETWTELDVSAMVRDDAFLQAAL
jgi:twitching motility protein PilI